MTNKCKYEKFISQKERTTQKGMKYHVLWVIDDFFGDIWVIDDDLCQGRMHYKGDDYQYKESEMQWETLLC